MRPTLGRTGEDFPRLNGSNFPVWNARIRAALDGQGLLGFIDQEDYDGDSDSSAANSDDEDPDPPKPKSSRPPSPSPSEELVSDTGTLPPATSDADDDQADAAAEPKTGGHASSEVPSDSSSGNSSYETGAESKSTQPSTKIPPAKKARAKLRAAKKRAARKPSAHERRHMERKTRSFLISTIDDAHVPIVEGSTSAFAIYQKLRDRYEGSTAHDAPYYINHYLMTIKYEEGTDLMEFFLTFKRALKAAAEATGIRRAKFVVPLPRHAQLVEFNLAIWKGSKKFIPYTDLKTNIERKVMGDYAKRMYIIAKGSLESIEMRLPCARHLADKTSIVKVSETALHVISNAPHGRDEPPRPQSGSSFTYFQRPNHAIRDCRVLQKHLRTGTVKEGTVLPANFAIIERKPRDDSNPFPIKHQRTQQRSDDRQRQALRNDNSLKAPDIYDRFGNPVSFNDLQRKYNSRGREAGLIAYATVIMPAIAQAEGPTQDAQRARGPGSCGPDDHPVNALVAQLDHV
ncbi:hypothetical protein PF001_g5466 [Phytophthora fragariae]|nr:hypothetical protein PF001_g5466 [Phytophthora fragariae]